MGNGWATGMTGAGAAWNRPAVTSGLLFGDPSRRLEDLSLFSVKFSAVRQRTGPLTLPNQRLERKIK
jgi:hypothetical protein